jgi:GH18 family chitinase
MYSSNKAKDICVYYSGWDIYERQYTLLPTPLASGFSKNFTNGGNKYSQQILPYWRNAYDEGTLHKITHIYYAFLAIMPTEEEYEKMKENTIYPINFNMYDCVLPGTDGFKGNGTIDTDNPSGVVYNNNIPPGTLVPTDWFEYYGLDYTPEEVYDDKGNLTDLKNPEAEWQDWSTMDKHPDIYYEGTHSQLMRVKKLLPHIKIIPSVGGWSDCWNFTNVFDDDERRKIFVESAVKHIVESGFDGIDLDWEYPGVEGEIYNYPPKEKDAENFVKVVTELHNEFKRVDPGKKYEITAAVGAAPENLEYVVDVAKVLTKISLMTYDYFNFEYSTNQAALYFNYSQQDEGGWNTYQEEKSQGFYTHAGVQYLLKHGIPPSKINIGIAAYYRGGQVNSDQLDLPNKVCAEFTGEIPLDVFGVQYGEENTGDYRAIIEADNLDGWEFGTDTIAMGGWAYNADNSYFISYDNVTTVNAKVDYIHTYNLNGCIVWDMYGDSPNKDSLLSILYNRLNANVRRDFQTVWSRFRKKTGSIEFRNPGTSYLLVGDDLPANTDITIELQGAGGGGSCATSGHNSYGGKAGEYRIIENLQFSDGDIIQVVVGKGGYGGYPYDNKGIGTDGESAIFNTYYAKGGDAGNLDNSNEYKGEGNENSNNTNFKDGTKETNDNGDIAYGGEASMFANGGNGNAKAATKLNPVLTGAGGASCVISNDEKDSYGDNAIAGNGGNGYIRISW